MKLRKSASTSAPKKVIDEAYSDIMSENGPP
jgi:hypothetical protein